MSRNRTLIPATFTVFFVLLALTGPRVKAAQAGCRYTVVPSSVAVGADGGDGVVAVTASDAGCSWTATSNAAWVTLGTPAYGYPAQVVADGAVGYWRLGESSGTTAADRSGHGLDGTVVGGVSWQAGGAPADGDSGATFDGSTGFVYVSPAALLDITKQITLEAWVKSTGTGGWQRLVGKGTNGSEWDLWISPLGQAHVQLGSTTRIWELTGTTVITNGEWRHVVATWDGTTTNIYVDGVLDASGWLSGTLVSNPSNRLEIGRDPLREFYTSGGLDEVAVYSQALTGAQVARHYALRTYSNAGGSGVVAYTVSPNGPNSSPRSATLTVAGTSVAVSQGGLGCAYTVTPASVSTDVDGGVAVIGVSTNSPGCSWTSSSNAGWVTLESISGYPGRVLADGAVGYWRLGESNGTVAADRTGHGFSGSVVGELAWQRDGALADGDRAAYFDGTDSYIAVSPTPSLDLTTALSLETWVQTTGTGGWQRLLGKGTNGSEWDLWVDGNGLPALQVGGASDPFHLAGRTAVADGQWHHLVATWDGSTARLYVDSALEASGALTGPLVPNPADGVVIGRDPLGFFTNGALDEVAIYNHALSGADVADHFALRRATGASIGSGVVVIAVEPNPLGDPPRNTSLTIAGLTVKVFEDGLTCDSAVAPLSITTDAAGASGVITLTPVHPSCTRSASSDAAWVVLSPIVIGGASGADTMPYTIAPNVSSARSATVTVAGRPIRVAQSAEAGEGRMTGAGHFGIPAGRLHFAFSVREREPQGERGRVSLWIPTWGSGWRPDRFTSRKVTSVTFSDDPAFQPGRRPTPTVDTVVFTGMGEWNGAPGYRYEIRASDRGEPGRGRDTLEVTIWNSDGVTVLRHYGDVLHGGNIQSYRLPDRVSRPPDTMPPDLALPRDVVKEATSPVGAIVTYDVSARDRVSGRVDVTCDVASGSTFHIGATVVHCFAADDAGNVANDSFRVTVRGSRVPVLTPRR